MLIRKTEAHHLVPPEKDRIINYEEGKRFFEVVSDDDNKDEGLVSKSANTEFETIRIVVMYFVAPLGRQYLTSFVRR
jgi:hypothetical protein